MSTLSGPRELTLEEILGVHEAFQPMLASQLLSAKLEQITEHKKDIDEAQKMRLLLAIAILEAKIPLPAFPGPTTEALLKQMKKQLKKLEKKAAAASS